MSNVDHFRFCAGAPVLPRLEYLMGVEYVPDLYGGFRYDDPMTDIPWPETVAALSAKRGN
jgi:hypothetical protein